MTKFLLDANLSPKTARCLSDDLGLDAVSLLRLGLGQLQDHDVLLLARREKRVIITLDRDFIAPYMASGRVEDGVIFLNLSGPDRRVSVVNGILRRFFEEQAPTIDLDKALVIIRMDAVEVITNDA